MISLYNEKIVFFWCHQFDLCTLLVIFYITWSTPSIKSAERQISTTKKINTTDISFSNCSPSTCCVKSPAILEVLLINLRYKLTHNMQANRIFNAPTIIEPVRNVIHLKHNGIPGIFSYGNGIFFLHLQFLYN